METGYAYTKGMKNDPINKVNDQIFHEGVLFWIICFIILKT